MNRINCLLGLLAVVVNFCLCFPTASRADDATTNTGNELVTFCNDKNYQANNSSWYVCVAFVDGVTQGFDLEYYLWLQHDNKVPKDYCPPANATHGQAALVVSKYLYDHPELLNISDALLVMSSVHSAWPCPKTSK